ncbi:RNA polymerase sigma factor [Singulisphaera sp. PoT]|uniref:RNA polymerase sigma factor n=1 Tax=Singulisphaera sp. PoT TaxID=3411797 RepID=UPI003BF61326
MTPPPLDPSTLLARAKAGDEEAWEELFHTFYPKVVRVVRRKLDRPLRSLYDSTDFASDVMKSLAANLERLDFPSIHSLMAFLAQAAEQKVIDEYRKRHTLKRDITRERTLVGSDSEGDAKAVEVASGDPTASEIVVADEVREGLLARRDEEERKIIDLKHQGYSNNEIAEQIGWNIRKVQRFFKDLEDRMRDMGSPQ